MLFDPFARRADAQPDRPAILQGKTVTDAATLLAQARNLIPDLTAAGVGPGRPLVVSASNSAGTAAHVLAAWGAGAVPVFVSPHAPPDHLDHATAASHAGAVLTDAGLSPAPAADPHPDLGAETGSVVFTSGSTGRPKGVVQTAATLRDGAERVARLVGYDADDRILCPVPWSHDYGWGQLLSCLAIGVPLVLPELPSVQSLAEAAERHRPTVLAGTPSVFAGMLYGISDIRSMDLSSIRTATSTGSRLPTELAEDISGLLPGVRIFANYGLTETYRTACLRPEERAGRETSVGRAVEGVRLQIIGEDGQPVPTGTVGQVVHHGAGRFAFYLNDPERTARTRTPDGGVLTGDLGSLDADGYLTLQGRRDRLIKSMDVQVSLDDVERVLGQARMTRQLAAIARPHKVIGMKIEVYAALLDPTTGPAFKRYARQNLSKFQFPREFHFVEAIPLTASGKVDYVSLSA